MHFVIVAQELGFGKTLGNAFSDVGKDLALAAVGVCLLAMVVLGLITWFSILDPRATGQVKSAMIKLIAGAAIIGGAGVGSTFLGAIAAKIG